MQKIVLYQPTISNYLCSVDVKCPHCGHQGHFENIGIKDIAVRTSNKDDVDVLAQLGIRRCPVLSCYGQLFFQELDGQIETYPFTKIDFESTDIPTPIVSCFMEALQCEAVQCFTASAIMVRKTLEMVCEDRGVQGERLVERLNNLQSEVTLPLQLFRAMDNLRILGNDAAHVELKNFDKIGKEELVVAIDLTKEILKAIYQLESIVGRLERLKKSNNK